MARTIHSRIRIQGQLRVMRSLHVGGIHSDPKVDLSLAINGKGEVYIPGTSLAGALRAYMSQAHGKPEMNKLWGHQEILPDAPVLKGNGHASFVVVEDAVVTLPSNEVMKPLDMEIRDGVGIDRHSGTAANNFKFNRAIIPRNATLPLNLTLEVKDAAQQDELEEQLNNTLAALSQGLIRLGGAKSRGLGCIKLENCTGQVQMLSSREGLLQLLAQKASNSGKKKLPAWDVPEQVANAPTQLKLTLEWEPVGPVMVKSEQSGVAVDILPLMSRFNDTQLGFVLPGSSIKGTLRSQAERILRTVLQSTLAADAKFAEQIQLPLACHLFGSAAQTDKSKNQQDYPTWASALFVEDCFSQQSYGADDFEKLATASKDNIRSALDVVDADNIQQAYHVAIDRWTGGAADQFLYTALEPFNLGWEPIEIGLNLDKNRLPEDEQEPAIALLFLLLRDFAHQRIPLGYGVNRGYGTVKFKQATIQLQGQWPDRLQALDGMAITKPDLSELGSLRGQLSQSWANWIQQHQQLQEAA